MNKDRNPVLLSYLLLLLTSFIWGISFVTQSIGTGYLGPWSFVFYRSLISAIVMVPVSVFNERRLRRAERKKPEIKVYLLGGLLCGLWLGLASIAQQAGIKYTTAGKTGFITAMYVVLVPVLSLFVGKKPSLRIWLCSFLGLGGVYLISVKEGFVIGKGDALVLLCAVLFSFQIMCVDHFSKKVDDILLLSNIQFFVQALTGFLGMLVFESFDPFAAKAAILPLLYLGILSGAAGYTLQMVAQKNCQPTVASLIMSLESVFSVLAGFYFLHQTLSVKEIVGCLLVFAAVVISSL